MFKRPSIFPVAAFALCIVLLGCTAEKKEPDAWMQDRQLVLQSIKNLQQQQEQLGKTLSQVQKELAEQQSVNQQQNAGYAALHEDVGQLKKQTRSLKMTSNRLKKSRKISSQKLDKKIEKIAQAIKPAAPTDQADGKEEEKDHYTAAYLALKSGRYDEAIEKFRDLLKSYPGGQYSDQAYYWLGESYLAQNDTGRAVGNLEWLVSHYPDSARHAAAMLRLGIAYQSQGRMDEAINIWRRLVKTNTASPAADQARKLLQSAQNAKTQ